MANTNPISPIVPGSTSVQDAIASANEAFVRVKDSAIELNNLKNDTGSKSSLNTVDKTSIVSALNEVVDRLNDGFLVDEITGDLADLETDNRENLVKALNEVVTSIGNLSSLETSAKSSIVSSINEIIQNSGSVGSLSSLNSNDKSTIVAAINEIIGNVGNTSTIEGYNDLAAAVSDLLTNFGTIGGLETSEKNSIVGAINEIKKDTDLSLRADGSVQAEENLSMGSHKITSLASGTEDSDAVNVGQVKGLSGTGDLASLTTTAKENIVFAINEIVETVGDLSELTTTQKSNLVESINELASNIDYQNMQEKLEGIQTVLMGTEVATDHLQSIIMRASATNEYDSKIQRFSGPDGNLQLLNKGDGYIYVSTESDSGTVTSRVRIRPDDNSPLEVYKAGSWVQVSTGGNALLLVGGTMTGPIEFDITDSSEKLVMAIDEFGIFSDDEGSYPGSASRLAFVAPVNSEFLIGPRTGQMKGLRINSERLDITGEIFSQTDLTLMSDERVKTDIHTIEDALLSVKLMRGVHYVKDDIYSTGVIAQEMKNVAPELVKRNSEGMLGVNYAQLAGYFIEAIKQISNEKDELQKKYDDLEKRVLKLEGAQ